MIPGITCKQKISAKLKRVACHINWNHVKSMSSDNQRDLHQNKQILGSLSLPFIAGAAGDNKWLKDLIGHWDSWGNSSPKIRASLSLFGRRQCCGPVALAYQLTSGSNNICGSMAQQEHGNWEKKAVHFICFWQAFCPGSSNRLFDGTGKGARGPPGKSLSFLSPLMTIINPVVVPTAEVTE